MFGHHQLDPQAFQRLVSIGQWVNFKPGEVLTEEGQDVSKVRLLVSGEAAVMKAGEQISTLDSPGHFIGEMTLMEKFIHLHDKEEPQCLASGVRDWALASATVQTTTDMVCF